MEQKIQPLRAIFQSLRMNATFLFSFNSTAMTKTEKRARERIGSSSSFLCCFGFPRKILSEKPMVVAEDGGEKKKNKKKKRSRWFLFSKFRIKNGEIKPAPIEEIEKLISRVEDETDKQKPLPVIRRMTDRKNIPADDKSVNQETLETKPKDLLGITSDRSKTMKQLGPFREATCQDNISNSTRHRKPDPKPSGARNRSRFDNFDSVIGISIIIITLVIMLICGRLCAILCTSAWCYFLPRLRDAAALAKRKRSCSDGSAYVPPDMNSVSYKRKVVLDGFLGRQNRVSLL